MFTEKKIEALNSKLTDIFKVQESSLVKDLLDVFRVEINELLASFKESNDLVLFDNHYSENIDKLGSNILEFRLGDNDPNYLERVKIAYDMSNCMGDDDTIIQLVARFFNISQTDVQTDIIDVRKIRITIPDSIKMEDAYNFASRIKVAGIKLEIEWNRYWEDFTYEELGEFTYEELGNYRYERRS